MTLLTPFERQVVDAVLQGSHQQLAILRKQAAVAKVSSREHTVVGAYVNFVVPPTLAAATPHDMVFGDVNVEVENVEVGVTALLFIKNGYISFLEFATYMGEWPKEPRLLKLGYFREEPMGPNSFSLIPVPERDPHALARALAGHHVQNAV